MREAFREWLQQCGHPANTQNIQVSQATRIERYYGDLDKAYDVDQFAAFRKDLTYSKEDERRGAPNPSKIPIDGNLYANLAGYRATLGYFERFRKASANGAGGFVFDLDALEQMKRVFLARYPDFSSLLFPASNGGYWDEERSYKQKIIDRAKELIQRDQISDFDLGTAVLELLRKPPANFVGWRALQLITSASADAQRTIIEALGELVRDPDDLSDVAARAATKIHPLMTNVGASGPAYGHVRSIVSTALALAHPESAFAVKTQYVNRLAKQLVGRALFKSEVMAREEYRSTLDFAEALFRIMRDGWRWEPRDLWDVQGFLWVNSDAETGEIAEDVKVGMQVTAKNETGMGGPTNLILYGPPGTGKTFATSARAVELCDGALPDGGRPAIMARYMDLVARRRIAFVTFHQSYSYEEFVEGLRPDTGGNDDAESDDGAVAALEAALKQRPAPPAVVNVACPRQTVIVRPRR